MPTTTISRCGGTPSGNTFPVLLLQSSPNALWKMNETSGTTAFDTLAGHHDAGAVGTTPTWGQSLAPPGDFGPLFPVHSGFTTTLSGYTPDLSGDFSAAIFARIPVANTYAFMGQGNPTANQPGWNFYGVGDNVGFRHMRAVVYTGATGHFIEPDANFTYGDWYWLVLTHAGALWTYYINGVAQAATYNGAYVGAGNVFIWMGWDGIEGYSNGGDNLSWAALWATRALSASEIAAMWAAL